MQSSWRLLSASEAAPNKSPLLDTSEPWQPCPSIIHPSDGPSGTEAGGSGAPGTSKRPCEAGAPGSPSPWGQEEEGAGLTLLGTAKGISQEVRHSRNGPKPSCLAHESCQGCKYSPIAPSACSEQGAGITHYGSARPSPHPATKVAGRQPALPLQGWGSRLEARLWGWGAARAPSPGNASAALSPQLAGAGRGMNPGLCCKPSTYPALGTFPAWGSSTLLQAPALQDLLQGCTTAPSCARTWPGALEPLRQPAP